jgi:DNA invertase Pin-like site-specific DNA recombinase
MARTDKSSSPALAYLRTSSAANVGADKDSAKRQRHAVQGFAKRAGFAIVEEFYDAAVSGADPIETRAGFAALLDRIEGNGVRTVIVEDASRSAREASFDHHRNSFGQAEEKELVRQGPFGKG